VGEVLSTIPSPILVLGLRTAVLNLANKQLMRQGEVPDTSEGIKNREFRLHVDSPTHPPLFLRAVLIALRITESLASVGLGHADRSHFQRIYERITVER